MTDSFKPVLYVKHQCPFSLKPWLMVLDAGKEDAVEIRSFEAGTPEEQAIRSELEPKLDKVSFPAAQVSPGQYMTDSDAIVAWLAHDFEIDTHELPAFCSYVTGPFPQLLKLYRENAELKEAAGQQKGAA